ncbi:hypothetical protein G6011_04702 [Alternaria panax]|uniref:Uncharacterized protein n=1 Tax=Alternaria panax TaxID=48097 RepID=A0AAD4IH04_9PLEO|nr:hypothetical protein G6011_04702 [Alternaria panax]
MSELSRSSSVISSMTPSTTASPLRAMVASSQVQGLQQDGNAPAFRLVAPDPGQETTSAGSPVSMSPKSPCSSIPLPTFSDTGTLVEPISSSPSTLFTPADPEVDASSVEPNFCTYYFPRHLPRSRVPCLECYSQPQWQSRRECWMKAYREQHPGVTENIEILSGVTAVRERFSA